MNVRHALLYGLTATLRQLRVVLVLYLVSLVFGLVLVVPLLPLLGQSLGHRLTGAGIESRLEVSIIADLVRTGAADLQMFHRFAGVLFLLHLLLATFLSGGILALLLSPRGEGWWARFLTGCGHFFGRFVRLLLIHLGILVVVAALNHGANLFINLLFEDSTHAWLAALAMVGKQLLLIVVLLGAAMVFGYARILTVLHDRRSMSAALATATAFVLRNAGPVITLRGLALAAGGAALAVYWLSSRYLLPGSAWLTLLVLQQVAILLQKFLSVLLYASELNLYRGRELSEDARLLSRLTNPEALRSALSP